MLTIHTAILVGISFYVTYNQVLNSKSYSCIDT